MYVSARSDYAVRAMLAVAAAAGGPVKASTLARTQQISLNFLHAILLDLRRAGLLHSHRGADGGYVLSRPAAQISIGDVLRAMEGSFTTIRGLPAQATSYQGAATKLRGVWLSVHEAIGAVVDGVTLADLVEEHRDEPDAEPVKRAATRGRAGAPAGSG